MTQPLTCVVVSATLVALTLGPAAVAAPLTSLSAGQAGQPPRAAQALLHDQQDHDSGQAVGSQNYESAFDDYDNQAADDFRARLSVQLHHRDWAGI